MSDERKKTATLHAPVFGTEAEIKPRDYSKPDPCDHEGRRYVVDPEARTVTCACGAGLDAFGVLLSYAYKERQFRHWRAEENKARKALHEAEEELQRVKARTRNASRKDAAEAVLMERKKQARERATITFAVSTIRHETEKIQRAMRRLSDAPGEETPNAR